IVSPTRPPTYTLHAGEWPYCIARRFNIDPAALLALNGLTDGQMYSPGLVLNIPQTAGPFPPPRALRSHPATYKVTSVDDTIYKIACYFGDVDPLVIATVNNLVSPYTLHAGQTLNIP
ncbi:MAG: LysM peptidoglycan-binding domain-containing protein, partial [Chloroflexi bacterium]|nr:LysM peptidoglycan-binding domain-containing protein [Chloroflexota bacterium]